MNPNKAFEIMGDAYDLSVNRLLTIMPEDLILCFKSECEEGVLNIRDVVARLESLRKKCRARQRGRGLFFFVLAILAAYLGAVSVSRLLPSWGPLGILCGALCAILVVQVFQVSDCEGAKLSLRCREFEHIIDRFQTEILNVSGEADLSSVTALTFSAPSLKSRFVKMAADVLRAEQSYTYVLDNSRSQSVESVLAAAQNLIQARDSFNQSWDVLQRRAPSYLWFSKGSVYEAARSTVR